MRRAGRAGAGALAVLAAVVLPAAAAHAAAGDTTRVSVASGGAQGDGASSRPSVSADGRYVAFESRATNLVPGAGNGVADIFVRDQQTGTVELVSVSTSGTGGNGESSRATISADGRYVAFDSSASNLVPGDTNSSFDVFVRDRQNGTTERVSVATDGTQADAFSGRAAISDDGRYVAFESASSLLVPGDTNGHFDIFVRDLQADTTTRVSVANDGSQEDGSGGNADISGDGRYVAFQSDSTNLVGGGDANGATDDVFVRDRQAGTTERVDVASGGAQANDFADHPSISADGQHVAFNSAATNLVAGDANGQNDIFLRNRQAGTTELVTVATDGTQANGTPFSVTSISADGRFVAFGSTATNLVAGKTNAPVQDIYVRDRQAPATTRRVSVATDGTEGDDGSSQPAISSDGTRVAFESVATTLVAGDTNGVYDVFVHDSSPPGAPVVTATNHGGAPANDNHPLVTGTATPGSSVSLYDNPACSGAPIGTGTAAEFASPGIAATVPDDSITRIYARATNEGGASACSSTSVGYEEISTLRWHVHLGAAGVNVSEAAGSITVTISRSGVADGTASVHYATADGTAGPGDYGAVSGTLTFSPGEISKTVDVPILDDQVHEAAETFTVTLSGPGLGTDIDAPAAEAVTITDDDATLPGAPDTIITSGPDRVSWTTRPTFTFVATDAAATFRCRVDGGAEIACKSPYTLPAVKGSGAHTFTVAAVSAAGVADPSPARRDFRIGETETHKLSCGLRAFAVDPKANSGYNGCSIEPAGHACSGIFASCRAVVPPCPIGAKCTYQGTANGADEDTHVLYVTNAYVVARVTQEIRADHGFSYGKAGMIAFAGCFHAEDGDTAVCPKTGSAAATIGDGSAPSFLCPTANSPNYSGNIPPSLGPDGQRFIRCDFTMTIEAAPTLIMTPSTAADGFTTFVPGAGTVTAAPAGASARTASIARARAKGAFRPVARHVKRAGPVRFKLTFSRSALATLKKKHRLVLRVRLVFKPRKGRTVSRTAKVTLLKLTGPTRPSTTKPPR